jgi:ATP-dependent Clp protease, protease subunit
VEYLYKLKKRLNRILSQHTGKPESQIALDSDRDNYMSAEEAKEYGLVDEVIKSRKELPMSAALPEPAGSNLIEKAPTNEPAQA